MTLPQHVLARLQLALGAQVTEPLICPMALPVPALQAWTVAKSRIVSDCNAPLAHSPGWRMVQAPQPQTRLSENPPW